MIPHVKVIATTIERLLEGIDPDIERLEWLAVVSAIKGELGEDGHDIAETWSEQGESYNPEDFRAVWKSITGEGYSIGVLFNRSSTELTKEERSLKKQPSVTIPKNHRKQEEKKPDLTVTNSFFNSPNAIDANNHPYLSNTKGFSRFPELAPSIRTIQTRVIYGETCLFLPLYKPMPTGWELTGSYKINAKGEKRLLKGSIKKGGCIVLHFDNSAPNKPICLYEGLATALAGLHAFPEYQHVVAIDAGNLPTVAENLRATYPQSNILVLGDNDKSGTGQKFAHKALEKIGGSVAIPDWIPGNTGKSTDWWDVWNTYGMEAMRDQVLKQLGQQGISDELTYHLKVRYLSDSIQEVVAIAKEKQADSIIIKSDLGTGKTTAIEKLIHEPDLNILYITPRKTLARNASKRLELDCYLDKGGNYRRFVCTVDSLPRYVPANIQYDYIVIDESETLAGHIVGDVMKTPSSNLEYFRNIVANAGTVICMDAHVDEPTRELLHAIGRTKPLTVINAYQPWKDMKVWLTEKEKDAIAKATDDLKAGKNINIMCNSKLMAETLHKELEGRVQGSVLVTSDTVGQEEVRDLLSDTSGLTRHQLVVASPTMGTGVSIDEEHFHKTYLFVTASEGTGTSKDALQQMARVRHPLDKEIVVCCYKAAGYGVADHKAEDKLNAYVNTIFKFFSNAMKDDTLRSGLERLANENDDLPKPNTPDWRYLKFMSSVKAHQGNDKAEFFQNIINALESKGMDVGELPIIGKSEADKIKAEHKASREEIKAKAIQSVIQAQPLSQAEYGGLKDKEEKTKEERDQMKRYRVEDAFLIDDLATHEDPEQLVKDFDAGIPRQADKLILGTETPKRVEKYVALHGDTSSVLYKAWGDDLKTYLLLREAPLLRLLLKAWGLKTQSIGTHKKLLEITSRTLKADNKGNIINPPSSVRDFLDHIKAEYKELKELKLAPRRLPKKDIGILRHYAKTYGLEVKQTRKREKGERVWHYSLAPMEKQKVIVLYNAYMEADKNWLNKKLEYDKSSRGRLSAELDPVDMSTREDIEVDTGERYFASLLAKCLIDNREKGICVR